MLAARRVAAARSVVRRAPAWRQLAARPLQQLRQTSETVRRPQRRQAAAAAAVQEEVGTQPAAEAYNPPILKESDIVFDSARNLREYAGLTGGQILEKKLREYGVTHVFGYTGGAVLPITDGFYGSPIKFVNNGNEQCAGHSAEGYAKAGGFMSTGIALATSGPGVTNLVTPLQDALTDSVPMIAFVGQVPTSAVGTDAFQECPTCAITTPCTKWSYQLKCIEEFPDVIDKAFYIAHSGKKGPVLIDLPKDVVIRELDPDSGYKNEDHLVPPLGAPKPENIANLPAIADMINKAKKPVIVAGQGALDSCETLRELAISASIPVATTLHGMGAFDEAHELSLQMLGMHGAAYANFAVQEADVIIGIGYRFDDRTTGRMDQYAPEARLAERNGRGGIIHFEIEKKQIGKVAKPTHAVHGDCMHTLGKLLPLIQAKGTDHEDRREWIKMCADWKRDYPFKWKKADNGRIKIQDTISEMNRQLAESGRAKDVIWTTGVGNHQMMCAQFVEWRWPRRILSSGSLGTMGTCLPYAIGAQMRHPDATVIGIDGDGSFKMTCNDLATLAENRFPVKIAVMNDGSQQMVKVWQTIYFSQRYVATKCWNPDFMKLAEAYGIKCVRVTCQEELEAGVREFLEHDGPVLGDFQVQSDMCTPMVAPGSALDDMILDPEEIMRLEINKEDCPG
eukprot:TRINITY_DN636_c8_g1_i1.p1 TRINITY_DN636_c8_g1~~TRINITY_DN636_c8_g1_i1.p1  ORF type:complete len:679 (+),score=192.91 TRINITY_DN636_c8_g1_i1:78-2114(+)